VRGGAGGGGNGGSTQPAPNAPREGHAAAARLHPAVLLPVGRRIPTAAAAVHVGRHVHAAPARHDRPGVRVVRHPLHHHAAARRAAHAGAVVATTAAAATARRLHDAVGPQGHARAAAATAAVHAVRHVARRPTTVAAAAQVQGWGGGQGARPGPAAAAAPDAGTGVPSVPHGRLVKRDGAAGVPTGAAVVPTRHAATEVHEGGRARATARAAAPAAPAAAAAAAPRCTAGRVVARAVVVAVGVPVPLPTAVGEAVGVGMGMGMGIGVGVGVGVGGAGGVGWAAVGAGPRAGRAPARPLRGGWAAKGAVRPPACGHRGRRRRQRRTRGGSVRRSTPTRRAGAGAVPGRGGRVRGSSPTRRASGTCQRGGRKLHRVWTQVHRGRGCGRCLAGAASHAASDAAGVTVTTRDTPTATTPGRPPALLAGAATGAAAPPATATPATHAKRSRCRHSASAVTAAAAATALRAALHAAPCLGGTTPTATAAATTTTTTASGRAAPLTPALDDVIVWWPARAAPAAAPATSTPTSTPTPTPARRRLLLLRVEEVMAPGVQVPKGRRWPGHVPRLAPVCRRWPGSRHRSAAADGVVATADAAATADATAAAAAAAAPAAAHGPGPKPAPGLSRAAAERPTPPPPAAPTPQPYTGRRHRACSEAGGSRGRCAAAATPHHTAHKAYAAYSTAQCMVQGAWCMVHDAHNADTWYSASQYSAVKYTVHDARCTPHTAARTPTCGRRAGRKHPG
jgi:hypothetical protein